MYAEILKTDQELKLCPFCGNEGILSEEEEWPDCAKTPNYYYLVGCRTVNCYCNIEGEHYCITEQDAIDQWNTRYE